MRSAAMSKKWGGNEETVAVMRRKWGGGEAR